MLTGSKEHTLACEHVSLYRRKNGFPDMQVGFGCHSGMERRYSAMARLSDRSVVMTGPSLNVALNADGTYNRRGGVIGTRVMIIIAGKYGAEIRLEG